MGRKKQDRIRENQFITVQGWMRNIPQITSNNELLVYALIYGFSQTEDQYLTCKQDYIAQWVGISRIKCNGLLSRMEQKGLIGKLLLEEKGAMKRYGYYCILPQENEEFTSNPRVTCSTSNPKVTRTSNPRLHVTSNPRVTHDNNIYNNNIYNMRARAREKTLQNQFNNFKQNDYDFEQLEIELVSNAPEKGGE